jgi:hypothetical protein
MRERKKHTVDVAKVFWVFDEVELGEAVEVSMHFGDGLSGLFVGRDECDIDVRVQQENTEELRAAVAGASEYADADFC